jgi:NAD(P)-dependent dehydrogenase (short-subunit alcohol dehydrogenase family)
MNSLKDRRILVTGGASGIGAAICALFAAEGARLAIFDLNLGGATKVADGLNAIAFAVDVADPTSVSEAVNRAANDMGGLDGVVNAAGISVFASLADTDLYAWDNAIAVNLKGPYLVCRACLPHLQKADAATILNISSAVALQPLANRSAYAASKAGLLALSKVLAMELAPKIRVNALCPGGVDTPMIRGTFTDDASIERVAARYALKRLGTAEEIAQAALFLTSTASSFVTGITLAADGGRSYH